MSDYKAGGVEAGEALRGGGQSSRSTGAPGEKADRDRTRARNVEAHSLVEQDVVLRAHSQVPPDAVHVRADVVSADESGSRRGREESGQNGPGREKETGKTQLACSY